MAEIGYGYGSEWHLMRFMARHRKYLEKKIRESIGVNDGDFSWLDFRFVEKGKAADAEIKGLSFLDDILHENKLGLTDKKIKDIKKSFISGWNSSQSWDAVFVLNNTIYLVEAKARIDEMKSNNKNNGGTSRTSIIQFMEKQLCKYGINVNKEWLGTYYQLANRLATVALLKNHGVNAKCVYIYFIDGFEKPGTGCKENANKDLYQNDYKMALIEHAFSWSFTTTLPFLVIAFIQNNELLAVLLIISYFFNTAIHAFVDDLKANKFKINLVEDQLVHLTQIICTWIILTATT